ncbi:MAG: response regulator transcription factor [Deltaproteobacteria bacterium]|nr:response regulator transcription factor [Deltaproteobacteria bacterium]
MNTIKILLAVDYPLIAQGLKSIVSTEASYDVACETGDGLKALDFVKRESPDIVLLDINITKIDAIEVTRRIVKESPNTSVIMLSTCDDGRYILNAFQAGAMGYLLKGSGRDEVLNSIKSVIEGRRYASRGGVSKILTCVVEEEAEPGESPLTTLTTREREVLELIAHGLKSEDVAKELCISVHTVKTHRSNLMRKLNAHSAATLVRIALKNNLA